MDTTRKADNPLHTRHSDKPDLIHPQGSPCRNHRDNLLEELLEDHTIIEHLAQTDHSRSQLFPLVIVIDFVIVISFPAQWLVRAMRALAPAESGGRAGVSVSVHVSVSGNRVGLGLGVVWVTCPWT